MQGPRVSVVINTYNRARRILATLEGLDRQTYRNFEVLVVNGPSTDDTLEVLRQYGGRIRIGDCPAAGLGPSRNIGIDMAAGEIVAFVDDDAVPRDAWLDRLAEAYAEPMVAGVGGYVFDGVQNRMQWKICICSRLGDPDTEAAAPLERYVGAGADPFLYLPGCNMSFRRSVLVEIGGFDERYSYGYEDPDVCCRIIDAGYRLLVRDDAIVDHYPAANHARDEARQPRDVYNWLRSHMVFALQHGRDRYGEERIAANLEREATHHREAGSSLLDRGIFTAEQWKVYLERIEQGIADGTSAGDSERATREFAIHRPALFRQYIPATE